jgi:ParB family chromosome partitioning protein
MAIHEYTLDQLDHSPKNVRTTRTKEAIEEMVSSIKSHGLLQSLVVHPLASGKLGVAIGGTRLEALRLLDKRKDIPGDFIIPADLRASDDPSLSEASLAENVMRSQMHPADEYAAFAALVADGHGPESIGGRFGKTARYVQQRMKLAAVNPKLMKMFRAGELNLDQMMAFSVSDDQKKQAKVWAELPEWAKRRGEGAEIRNALTDQHIETDSKLAKFVGVEAAQSCATYSTPTRTRAGSPIPLYSTGSLPRRWKWRRSRCAAMAGNGSRSCPNSPTTFTTMGA